MSTPRNYRMTNSNSLLKRIKIVMDLIIIINKGWT